MCNLYSQSRSRNEVAAWFRVGRDRCETFTPQPAIYPDGLAPVIRLADDGVREMVAMRWGFPPPPAGARPVTNVRNTASLFWRPWLEPAFRCLVPFTAFCETSDAVPKIPHWFAAGTERPVLAFAGIWRSWTGTRGTKARPASGEHELFAFLTCAPNALVAAVHAKAMPVVLACPEDQEHWLREPVTSAMALQSPAEGSLLQVVSTGTLHDPV